MCDSVADQPTCLRVSELPLRLLLKNFQYELQVEIVPKNVPCIFDWEPMRIYNGKINHGMVQNKDTYIGVLNVIKEITRTAEKIIDCYLLYSFIKPSKFKDANVPKLL